MTYLPKSKIRKFSTPGGEYIIKNKGVNYIGDLVETSKGKLYVGHNNYDLSIELIKAPKSFSEGDYHKTQDVQKHNIFKKDILVFLQKTTTPPPNKQKPTLKDYERGFYKRYFTQRINSPHYIEINDETYKSLKSKDKKYDHNLYIVGTLNWHLVGEVFKLNSISLIKTSRGWKNISTLFPLLNEFHLPESIIRENLTTSGNELYLADGSEYIGEYHIHPNTGPMRGSQHEDGMTITDKLYYMSQLPKPGGLNYEDWLSNQPLPPIPIVIPKTYIEFSNPGYFSSEFRDEYAVGSIGYSQGLNFHYIHDNTPLKYNDTDYFTSRFYREYIRGGLRFDSSVFKFYKYEPPRATNNEVLGY